MNYRSSKLKAQSSNEAPVEKLQKLASGAWWAELERESNGDGPLILREEPPSRGGTPPRDLLERTTLFGEAIVRFSKKIPLGPSNDRLIDQLVGAGTSTGANYCEANEAVSKKDFKFTISRCMKEAKETKFFLRMIVASEPQFAQDARPLYREAHELLRIFGSMRHKP